MLNQEVNHLLKKIERELLAFVSFIKNVEEEYAKSSNSDKKSKDHDTSKPKNKSREISLDGEYTADGIAVVDAFNIVRNVLLKISNVIDDFSALTAVAEKNLENRNSYLVKYHYAQYVYQIASYLVKTVEEHLGNFSEKLNQLAAPPSHKKDGSSPSRQRKILPPKEIPIRHFKFRHFKPTAVCMQNPKKGMHPRALAHKCSSEHPPDSSSSESVSDDDSSDTVSDDSSDTASDEPEDEESPEDDRNGYRLHEESRGGVNDARTDEVLNRLANSLNALVPIFEELLFQLKSNKCTRHTQTPPATPCNIMIPDIQAFPFKRKSMANCCSINCTECCAPCKYKHKTHQMKTPRPNMHCEALSWTKDLLPILNTEPHWMQTNPRNASKNKLFASSLRRIADKDGNVTSSQTEGHVDSPKKGNTEDVQSTQDHSTPIPLKAKKSPKLKINYNDFLSRNSQDNLFISHLKDSHEDVVKNSPSGKRKKKHVISTGELIPKTQPPVESPIPKPTKKNESPTGILMSITRRFSPGIASFTQKLQGKDGKETPDVSQEPEVQSKEMEKGGKDCTERGLKPVFVEHHKGRIHGEGKAGDKFGGFCILPETRNKTTSISKSDILVNRTENEDGEYPEAILFDLYEFSDTLKSKFRDHFKSCSEVTEKLESQLVLDMTIRSIEEALRIYDQGDEIPTGAKEITYPSKKREIKDDFDDKAEKDLDHFIKEAMKVAKQISQGGNSVDEKHVKVQDAITIDDIKNRPFRKSSSLDQNFGSWSSKDLPMAAKKHAVSLACEQCQNMVKSTEDELKDESLPMVERRLTKIPWRDRCFKCWNSCQRGLTIHQCHDTIPAGLLEIRHMDSTGKIHACFVFWNRKKEHDDWRWHKSPFYDPTRVELEQQTTTEKDPVLKVIYGPQGTMVKESLAETQLPVVSDFPVIKTKYDKAKKAESKFASWINISQKRKLTQAGTRSRKLERPKTTSLDRNMLIKLARFFDDVQQVGYGKGPPLIIKVRRNRGLHDAYDLLMAPSRIRLNYYRSLRVIFISDSKTKVTPSSSNFFDEDESNELFELFSRRLFSSSDKCLFEYPSEETQYLYLNPESSTHPQWFRFAGSVLALTILHQKKMDVKLPLCFFKCLLDRPIDIEDLQEIDPLFYQKLMWMKENNIKSQKQKMFFVIKDHIGGEKKENELMVNGKKIEVTENNKFRYIDLAVKWKLAERCLTQFRDFRGGFASVIDPCFLTMFSPKELQELIRQPPSEEIFLTESTSRKCSREITRRETW